MCAMMDYLKPPLTFAQQADLLIGRGLMVDDRERLIRRLSHVNYYRLSGYWHPFQQVDERFRPGTSFSTIWDRYLFDRKLRLLVLDMIERVEVSIKTTTTQVFTLHHDPCGYLHKENFDPVEARKLVPRKQTTQYEQFDLLVRKDIDRSREPFILHHKKVFGEEVPLWKACEVMSFGTILSFYRLLEVSLQQEVAATYNAQRVVLGSWLHCLSYIRNICAHHGRLWNRPLAIRPMFPSRDKRSPAPLFPAENDHIYAILCIGSYLMDFVAPRSRWKYRVIDLMERNPDIPTADMGFPPLWRENPLWSSPLPRSFPCC